MEQGILLRRAPIALLDVNARVAELISGDGGWNIEILKENFDESHINSIKNTHLDSSLSGGDRPWWCFYKDGAYSVKSGVQVAIRIKELEASSSKGCIDTF